MRLILVSISAFAFALPITAQTTSSVEALRELDFKSVLVGVANAEPGEDSASSFMKLIGGVTIDSITGCTMTLRNEQTGKGRKWIYHVVIPLNELSSKGTLSQATRATQVSGDISVLNLPFFLVRYDVKDLRRLVTLHGPNSTAVLARGAHVSFGVKERVDLDLVNAAFAKAIDECNQP